MEVVNSFGYVDHVARTTGGYTVKKSLFEDSAAAEIKVIWHQNGFWLP